MVTVVDYWSTEELKENMENYMDQHNSKIIKLHEKIFEDLVNMFNNIPNLTKLKINKNTYKIIAPNFQSYLYYESGELRWCLIILNTQSKEYMGFL